MRFYEKVGLSFANLLLKALFFTLRKSVIAEDSTVKLIEKGKVIIVMWHERLFVPVYFFKKSLRKNMYPLISKSKDGEMIAYILKKQGFNVELRGSSSRGGVRVLSLMVKKLLDGKVILVTPDGPRGPRRELKEGVLHVALKSKAPIIGMGYRASSEFVFNSWDKFKLPKPFSKTDIFFSKPYFIDDKNFNKHKKNIEEILNSFDNCKKR